MSLPPVEKGVQVPPRYLTLDCCPIRIAIAEMDDGDSRLFDRQGHATAFYMAGRRAGFTMIQRKMDGGHRVWKIGKVNGRVNGGHNG